MYKVNCLNPIAQVGMDVFTNAYERVDNLADAQVAMVRSAAMHDLELPENLLAIARAGAGVNNIPLDKCAEKGIVVFNTPGANANGVKEAGEKQRRKGKIYSSECRVIKSGKEREESLPQ